MQIKLLNFKFEVLSSETSNIEFHWSFEVFFWRAKKLHIWSYRVSFGNALTPPSLLVLRHYCIMGVYCLLESYTVFVCVCIGWLILTIAWESHKFKKGEFEEIVSWCPAFTKVLQKYFNEIQIGVWSAELEIWRLLRIIIFTLEKRYSIRKKIY